MIHYMRKCKFGKNRAGIMVTIKRYYKISLTPVHIRVTLPIFTNAQNILEFFGIVQFFLAYNFASTYTKI